VYLKHICPFCGKEHELECVPDPISQPCPECARTRTEIVVVLHREEWLPLIGELQDAFEASPPSELHKTERIVASIIDQVVPKGGWKQWLKK
jgi:hypothetical protein